MSFLEMYEGKVNSPTTTLTQPLNAVAAGTIETVSVSDANVLPPAPNLATIGSGELAETIRYTAKTGNDLTAVRGFQGGTNAWTAGTPIARFFTAYDHDANINNITELQNNKAEQTGTYANLRAQATTKEDIGLGNVDNVQQIAVTEKGAINGVASLDATGNVPLTQLGNVESMEIHGNEWHSEDFISQAYSVGTTPPLNTNILWVDTSGE